MTILLTIKTNGIFHRTYNTLILSSILTALSSHVFTTSKTCFKFNQNGMKVNSPATQAVMKQAMQAETSALTQRELISESLSGTRGARPPKRTPMLPT